MLLKQFYLFVEVILNLVEVILTFDEGNQNVSGDKTLSCDGKFHTSGHFIRKL